MIDLIEELKIVMEERSISPEGASRYIGCAGKSVYRWIHGEVVPNLIYRGRIIVAIRKMKRDFPVEDKNIRKGRAHLETLTTFLPRSLKIKDEKRAVKILANLTPEELSEIYVSGMDQETATVQLKKHGIEVLRSA